MGKEGEDIVATNAADGGLSLRMPARYHPASVKGAAWQVWPKVLLGLLNMPASAWLPVPSMPMLLRWSVLQR